ncbi:MAG: hypothetical protein P8Z75_13220 [Gammaproteobacteria bacterium]
MKESHRTRRMERHHKRNKKTATLNMVSMMDIFTILVFFLLVSRYFELMARKRGSWLTRTTSCSRAR